MTKKDFELLANALRVSKPTIDEAVYPLIAKVEYEQWLTSIEYIVDALRTTNPRFNKVKFMNACGV
jgi:hypothetical protein